MNTEYKPSFIKDLKALKSTPVYDSIKSLVFEEIPSYSNLDEISNLKKLKDADNTYRVRVGDYRIGFTFEEETITFVRVLHRKDIYRYFTIIEKAIAPLASVFEIAINQNQAKMSTNSSTPTNQHHKQVQILAK
ncbi:MAG: type II toxin-antitoxin system RelE/ParE family toxin [Fischerella sp. CENA71]|nr:type II toxin-antitoxin system RelE/ParE family toxin [Fischerella sp. CENA71]